MKHIVCLGDSITDAQRLFSPDGLGYGYVKISVSYTHLTLPTTERV